MQHGLLLSLQLRFTVPLLIFHGYHPDPGQHRLSPGPLQVPPAWSPSFPFVPTFLNSLIPQKDLLNHKPHLLT